MGATPGGMISLHRTNTFGLGLGDRWTSTRLTSYQMFRYYLLAGTAEANIA
ncbi:conserved hypothetical protein [Ricinus communis]|uniref:Uncharacterized protein n=1 Tax=Ricinus communis TaxID=3988 RepID=B9S2I0_RICCO|nr:conserved hypothetical protein [Ricinus communis]